nr:hypothetical protein [Tanacetum cinerariifolium]
FLWIAKLAVVEGWVNKLKGCEFTVSWSCRGRGEVLAGKEEDVQWFNRVQGRGLGIIQVRYLKVITVIAMLVLVVFKEFWHLAK